MNTDDLREALRPLEYLELLQENLGAVAQAGEHIAEALTAIADQLERYVDNMPG